MKTSRRVWQALIATALLLLVIGFSADILQVQVCTNPISLYLRVAGFYAETFIGRRGSVQCGTKQTMNFSGYNEHVHTIWYHWTIYDADPIPMPPAP